jgi:hypothetical protein
MYIPDLYSALIRANVPFKGALQQMKKRWDFTFDRKDPSLSAAYTG